MTSEAAKYQIINNWPVQTGKKKQKHRKKQSVQNLGCFYGNKIIGIRSGKEVVQFLPPPPTTGYCLQAENNIKLIIYTASNKEKEGGKHITFKQEVNSKIFIKPKEFCYDLLS